jgi:hypothetical protein
MSLIHIRGGIFLNPKSSARMSVSAILFLVISGILITIGILINQLFPNGEFNHNDESFMPGIGIADIASSNFSENMLDVTRTIQDARTTYSEINFEDIFLTEGLFMDPQANYVAYSFYLKNTGKTDVNVSYYIRLTEIQQGVDDYVRIMIIEDDTHYDMYQKEDVISDDSDLPIYENLPEGILFLSQSIILRKMIPNFLTEDVKLFRIIIWLEEQDPDMTVDNPIGKLSLALSINIDEPTETLHQIYFLGSSDNQNLWIPLSTACHVSFDINYE